MKSPRSKDESVDILREEFLRERAAVLGRAGTAVEDAMAELAKIDQEIQIKKEQLQSLIYDEQIFPSKKKVLVEEINLHIEQFNIVIEKARLKFYYLIVTREAMGLRRHKMIQELYVIPKKKKKMQDC
jgi:hypothetical protein